MDMSILICPEKRRVFGLISVSRRLPNPVGSVTFCRILWRITAAGLSGIRTRFPFNGSRHPFSDAKLQIFHIPTKKKSKNLRIQKLIANFALAIRNNLFGKMPEWSIGTVSKTVVPLRVPRVRIPVFPQPTDNKTSRETLKPQTVRQF